MSNAGTGLYSRYEIAWIGTPFDSRTLLISVSVIRIHSDKNVDMLGERQIKMTLSDDMLEAYRSDALRNNHEYQSHEYRVMQEKHRHILGMLDAVAESLILWICNESGLNRTDVMAL